LWRLTDEHWELVGGPPEASTPTTDHAHPVVSRLAVDGVPGLYLEVRPERADVKAEDVGRRILPVIDALLEAQRTVGAVTNELAARYEEIDLLYSIGQILGQKHAVEEVATIILREISAVVGARRAGLRIYDEERRVLRSIGRSGPPNETIPLEVPIDESDLLVSRAFLSGRITVGPLPGWVEGEAMVVPIVYSATGTAPRAVGTLALAERAGGGQFTREETKLVAAVATQIGAALENARLVARERDQERVARELELAHDLQVKLMPLPAVLRGAADVAVHSVPAESLGGDLYSFVRLGPGRVGVMLGDVSSHGFAAALIAAQVMAALGIHARSTTPPDEALELLRGSLAEDLERTEMHLSLFYGVLDRSSNQLTYSNAGHPHAFRLSATGAAERLDTTSPPLGLVPDGELGVRTVPWTFGTDLLALFTDGMVDQCGPGGERFGEGRIIERLEASRTAPPEQLVRELFDEVTAFGDAPGDDCTLLLLRM
jgi:sigma-B regulation protein RsbU (phosphoserine phosphatase)